MVSAAVFPVSRAASVTRDLRSCKTSTGRVHLQMMRSPSQWPASPRLSMVLGRSWIDARSLMVSREGLARRGRRRLWRRVRMAPQGLGLLCGPIDEGVDCLAADGPQPRFVPDFNQPEICSGVHPSASRSPTNNVKRPLVRGSLHAACAIDRLRRREAANTRPRGARSAAAPWRWWFSPDRALGQWPHRPPRGPQNADLVSFVLRQMRIGSHGNTP